MSILTKKSFPLLLLGVLGAVALFVMASQFDFVSRWRIHSGVDDLVHGRNLEASIKELVMTPRGPTIEALKDAIESEDGTPWGKVNALQLLGQFKEERAVARAIDSDVLSTRRAAAYLRQGDPEMKEVVGEIALAWLKDPESEDRHLAPILLRTTERKDATADLIEILRTEGDRPESSRLIVHVLGALTVFKPQGIAPDVMKLAADKNAEDRVRTEAFTLLTQLEDAPRGPLRQLLIEVATDKGTEKYIRNNAVSALGDKKNATEEGWNVLKEILFSEDPELRKDEKGQILQRSALRALARSLPLERLPGILLDRRVYTHPYFGVRTDVASGLGNLRDYVIADEKDRRLALTVLADLMEDDDPRDFADNVPRQAWISHWQLCGTVIIPDEFKDSRRFFLKPPSPFKEEDILRTYLFSISHGNPQITEAQVKALNFCTLSPEDGRLRTTSTEEYERRKASKLEAARQVADTMRSHIERCVEKMAKDLDEKKKADKKRDDEKDEKKTEDDAGKKDDSGAANDDSGKKDEGK